MARRQLPFVPFVAVLLLGFLGWGDTAIALTKGDVRRVNDEGPVEITVVYLNPLAEKSDPGLSFEVRMNTHSVNLDDYDMGALSTLRINGRSEKKAIGWFEPGGGGHHVSGVLKFSGPLPSDADHLELIIRDVGSISVRKFEWTLPLK